jgi:hypothetical protein
MAFLMRIAKPAGRFFRRLKRRRTRRYRFAGAPSASHDRRRAPSASGLRRRGAPRAGRCGRAAIRAFGVRGPALFKASVAGPAVGLDAGAGRDVAFDKGVQTFLAEILDLSQPDTEKREALDLGGASEADFAANWLINNDVNEVSSLNRTFVSQRRCHLRGGIRESSRCSRLTLSKRRSGQQAKGLESAYNDATGHISADGGDLGHSRPQLGGQHSCSVPDVVHSGHFRVVTPFGESRS